jgi:hypothetical protein
VQPFKKIKSLKRIPTARPFLSIAVRLAVEEKTLDRGLFDAVKNIG